MNRKMNDAARYIAELFRQNNVAVPPERKALFETFVNEDEVLEKMKVIVENQHEIMHKWKVGERIASIIEHPFRIANATVGKAYEADFDIEKIGWPEIVEYNFQGLEDIGLSFSSETKKISGTPLISGDLSFLFRFKLESENIEKEYHEKQIPFIVNPDPRSLWKNIESDRADPYWKEDDVTVFESIGDKHILVSSKRGRSHANAGSFREDDFAFAALGNGWNVVTVSDGAGSAKASRIGSSIACKAVVEHFRQNTAIEALSELDPLISPADPADAEIPKKLNHFLYNNLGRAAFKVHKELEDFAKKEELALKDLSCTLIFVLFKRYESGYAMLSFGVGDCPIAVLNKELTEVSLLNWIDVGEFGGGTRFITMPEIFTSDKFSSRFGYKFLDDFSYLMLMSDGIYDPKFIVEANLPNIVKWQEFLSDLKGNNEEKVGVNLEYDNPEIRQEFSKWMDFWSKGNHDDRTLAIVF